MLSLRTVSCRPGLQTGSRGLRRSTGLLVAGLLAAGLAGAQEEIDSRSPRTIERLKLTCGSVISHRDVTLFANGTVRVRSGLGEDRRMWLHELREDELEAFVARLLEPTRNETEAEYDSVVGEWVDNCLLALDLPGQRPAEYSFGQFDSVSLDLQRVIRIAREIESLVDESVPASGEERLPMSYQPQIGDMLRRGDGSLFRVRSLSVDGLGVELEGVRLPITIYATLDDVRRKFVAVEGAG